MRPKQNPSDEIVSITIVDAALASSQSESLLRSSYCAETHCSK
jgi:hypothetical protein